jgi:pimeloyl-ACP methyl ester carboxylesterase
MAAREIKTQVVRTNNIGMHVAESGDGPPLVFMHGLGWDHTLWGPAMMRFSDHYRVIAADTRGHGVSDKPAGPYSIDLFAQDWHGLLKALELERPCIVGFSQGGMTAQVIATRHPQDVGPLFLVSTACRSDPAVRDKLEERIKQSQIDGPVGAARIAAKSIFSPAFAAAHPEVIEDFIAWRAAMEQPPLIAATRAGYGFDVSARLKAVTVPAKVVYGAEDVLTPPAVVKQVAAALPAAELEGVPGAGHMIPVEQPSVFYNILASFLEKHYPVDTNKGVGR